MDLTLVQRRTLESLIQVGPGREFGPEVAGALRERIESRLADVDLPEGLRLSKERLNEHGRCPGMFDAVLSGERPPFAHRLESATGTVLHKAVEQELLLADPPPLHEAVEAAVARLGRDKDFGPWWGSLDNAGRGECLMRAASYLDQFRASFPPIGALRRELAPIAEHWLEVRCARGRVKLIGKVDLVLNAGRPGRSTRVLVDLKTGMASPEQAEDVRLYALLHTLRTGTPPCRVATFYVRAGEWQAEDVSVESLEHAADRVVAAVRTAAELQAGIPVPLTPGPYCRRCRRRDVCPLSQAIVRA